ncbi:4-phosphoerythronate dehydrogenase [Rhodohalobacter mucosus]|uniref:Erythronate-4-phosphate dehydrogenase n=1 Tax=Rhodohalobacter mucosus TaxID=2079485 RepID=A0A316TTQ4_9BACT|nr:4-phosphoerythronate dehydrogenase [Rhodohalobacter mucosus]PWN05664.1 hypothetical protein DDZ15_13825 [Rhodohalobacter mucosus]
MNVRILADKHLYHAEKMAPTSAELSFFEPANGLPADAADYDALLIRTVSRINSDTLPVAGNLSFIGTATAGFDHVDREHLERIGVRFAHSPGCNARAVAEYVLTAILRWSHIRKQTTEDLRVGVVGCGNTGSAVIDLLSAFEIGYAAYDPPRAISEPHFVSASEDELLSCNILTFHTPLTLAGPHSTFHMLSSSWLRSPFQLIINAARGGVVDERALLDAIHRGTLRDCVLDVWEHEPAFSDTVAQSAFIATPHIAGYSREAKTAATRMVLEQLCEHFSLEMPASAEPAVPDHALPVFSETPELADFLWEINKVDYYDSELRKLKEHPDAVKSDGFNRLRTSTPTRFEYATLIAHFKRHGVKNIPEEAERLIK